MGNQHSGSHNTHKPSKNVRWKTAGRPGAPGKPDIIPIVSDDEPNAITLRWAPAVHDGGAPLLGYQVECNRLGSPEWIRTAPPVVLRPELVLSGLDPPHRYQFRVAALNALGPSEYSALSDVLNVGNERASHQLPAFLQHLEDITALENDKTEFRVTFTGVPTPTIAWFKDDYEIFSSRRTAITSTDSTSVLVFHQTLSSDEGEIKCTATNRGGHVVTRARLSLEAAPKLRYPRQYEDGLLYEINETVFLKTTIVGKPTPIVEWRHDGQPIVVGDRVEISNTSKYSILKIHSARRSDRGEYQIQARNRIGEDTAAFLVTVTAPPDPPRRVLVTRQVDKSVTLDWDPPEDDGGCRIGNYIVEYYRSGWNVWLKATTSRKTNVTLFDLIEGSEYRFRVKAESPYGMSVPSVESAPVRIPGRAVDMEFLAVESKIINEVLTREGSAERISPAPRRKRHTAPSSPQPPPRVSHLSPHREPRGRTTSNEFMLVLYPENHGDKKMEKPEKRQSIQLDPDSLSPPAISFSAPELSTRCIMPFKGLRNAVSSSQLLHEIAMARFRKAVAMKEEQSKTKDGRPTNYNTDIPYNTSNEHNNENNKHNIPKLLENVNQIKQEVPEYIFKSESNNSESIQSKWQQISFDEDYTASTVSDGDYSENGSVDGDLDRRTQYSNEEETYNPRGKIAHPSPFNEELMEEEELPEHETLKPLPLPDPNFILKPILKRREADIVELRPVSESTLLKSQEKTKLKSNVKKDEKLNLFKKITKMPIQKPFPFPKLLQKKDLEKDPDDSLCNEKPKTTNKTENIQDKVSEEGKTVIDYYGNIVKEYGSQKRPTTPIYLKTEDLKAVAERQQLDKKEANNHVKSVIKPKKLKTNKTSVNQSVVQTANTINKSKQTSFEHPRKDIKNKINSLKIKDAQNKIPKKIVQQVLLKKTERATVIIPINYQELEEKAKINVRSAIDYTVDVCLLLLAFWVYFFKDERLAIPFLILIIYRQLQETLIKKIPEWYKRHSPSWLNKKTS